MKRKTEEYHGKRTAQARRNWRKSPPSYRQDEISAWRSAGDKVKFMALKWAKENKRIARKIISRGK